MWVYIVIRETRHEDEIVRVFTSKTKAEDYKEEQNNTAPYYSHRVETYWAV